jgi:hypothetical protein
MQYSTALSDSLLAIACLACLLAIGKLRSRTAEDQRPGLFCMQMGFALPLAAAVVGALRFGLMPDLSEMHGWLSRASSLLGLPLLGLAALCLGRQWHWSGPTWGRLLLGLCAFFELFRQLGWLDEYRMGVQLGSLLLIVYGGWMQWPQHLPLLLALAVAALFGLAGLVIGTEGSMGWFLRIDLFHALLALAYPLLAWLLIRLAGRHSQAKAL